MIFPRRQDVTRLKFFQTHCWRGKTYVAHNGTLATESNPSHQKARIVKKRTIPKTETLTNNMYAKHEAQATTLGNKLHRGRQ